MNKEETIKKLLEISGEEGNYILKKLDIVSNGSAVGSISIIALSDMVEEVIGLQTRHSNDTATIDEVRLYIEWMHGYGTSMIMSTSCINRLYAAKINSLTYSIPIESRAIIPASDGLVYGYLTDKDVGLINTINIFNGDVSSKDKGLAHKVSPIKD